MEPRSRVRPLSNQRYFVIGHRVLKPNLCVCVRVQRVERRLTIKLFMSMSTLPSLCMRHHPAGVCFSLHPHLRRARKKSLETQVVLLTTTRWQYGPNQDEAGKLVSHDDKQIQRLKVSVQGTRHLVSQSFQTILPLCVFLLPQKLELLFRGPSLQKQICPKLHPDGSREGEDMRAEQSISPSAIATISSTS